MVTGLSDFAILGPVFGRLAGFKDNSRRFAVETLGILARWNSLLISVTKFKAADKVTHMKSPLIPNVHSRFLGTWLSAAILIAGSTSAPALRAQAPAGPGGLEITNVSGVLQAVSGDKFKIKSEDGEEHIAVLAARSSLKYNGTADSKFLQPGLFVRFSASFNTRTGTPQAPLQELEIFRPIRQRRMSQAQRQNQTSGVYPAAQDDKKNGKQSPPVQNTGEIQDFKIVGQIRAVQGGKMQVVAGNRPLIVPLDSAVKINVQAGDAMFCMSGDSVKVTGLRNPNQANWIQAETIEITGTKALGLDQPNQKPTKPKSRSRGDKKPPQQGADKS